MSRPRTVTDDEIADAVRHVLGRGDSAKLSLAEIGAACGLSAPGLVQRFGSRQGVLLAYARRRAEAVPVRFAAAGQREASPLLAMSAALAAAAEHDTPAAVAADRARAMAALSDPGLRAMEVEQAQALRAEIARCLEAAVAAGELAPCDHAGLARTVLTAYEGALSTWAVLGEGALEDWLADELEAVLAPYLA